MNERVHMKRRQITKQLCRLRRAVFKTIRSLDEGKIERAATEHTWDAIPGLSVTGPRSDCARFESASPMVLILQRTVVGLSMFNSPDFIFHCQRTRRYN